MLNFLLIFSLLFCSAWCVIIEGDIALPTHVDVTVDNVAHTYLMNANKLWPNGNVPFRFETFGEEPLFSDSAKTMIKAAIGHIMEKVPCLTFREVDVGYRRAHLIYSTMGDNENDHQGCWSFVGSQGAQGGKEGQTINLGSPGCINRGTVLHETLHALGADHEQNRNDRDRFVYIVEENILKENMKNFKKAGSLFSSRGTPYDYASIMHYDDDYFSVNGKRTIIPLKHDITLSPTGSKSELSTIDIMELALVYSNLTVKNCFTEENQNAYHQFLKNQCLPTHSDVVTVEPIARCETSFLQFGFNCEKAFNGDITTYETPGYINGWAYGAKIPAWAIFHLKKPSSVNTVIFKTGLNRGDHHLNDFAIEVQVGNRFEPVTITRVNSVGTTITGSRVKIVGQEEVRVAFENKMNVRAVKIHAYGSDADPNENSVVNQILVLFLTDVNMIWSNKDVDVLLNKIPVEGSSHLITRCDSSYLQKGYSCDKAYNGDITTHVEPGFINGWAYGGKNPAWVVFYLKSPVPTNTIIIKTGLKRRDHHLNDFAIDVQVGNKFIPVTIRKVNNADAKNRGARVKIVGQEELRITFDMITDVSAIKVHAYGSDAHPNENSVINQIVVLFIQDALMDWSNTDVDRVLSKFLPPGTSHLITGCDTSHLQRGYSCDKAFDGDITSQVDPGYINGWAYGGNIPAWVVFYLDSPVTSNTIILKTGLKRRDHHLNDFAIEVEIKDQFHPVAVTGVNTPAASIKGSRVKIAHEDAVRITFDTKTDVTAVKIYAYGSDAGNENSVVNQIFVLFLPETNFGWSYNDVDEILDNVLPVGISHLITRCDSSYLQTGFNCEKAYNGDITTYVTPGYINGWAYGGKNPAWAVFYLETPVAVNTIVLKTGWKRRDHHLNDFAIELLVKNKFEPVIVKSVNSLGVTLKGSRIKLDGQEEVRVAFEKKTDVAAVKVHAYGSDADPNENSVVNQILVLCY